MRDTTFDDAAADLRTIFASWSHQCRNALFRIQACLDLIEMEPLAPEVKQLIAGVAAAQEHLIRLQGAAEQCVTDVAVRPEVCDLAELVQSAWDEARRSHPEKETSLTTSLADDALSCCADPAVLRRVVVEVLRNALEASEETARVEIIIDRTTDDSQDMTRIAIRNFGEPLSERQMDRMFDPFFTTKHEAAGIGLTTARKAMRAHGGSIQAANAEDGAVEITLLLPCDAPREQ